MSQPYGRRKRRERKSKKEAAGTVPGLAWPLVNDDVLKGLTPPGLRMASL